MILTIAVILVFTPLAIIACYRSYRSRKFKEDSEHIELQLTGIHVNWMPIVWFVIFGLLFLWRFNDRDTDGMNPNDYWLFIICLYFGLTGLGNILLQLMVEKDRLILKPGKILLLSDSKLGMPTQTIYELALDGFTNQVKLRGSKVFSFPFNKISKEHLSILTLYLKQEIAPKQLKISPNLKSHLPPEA